MLKGLIGKKIGMTQIFDEKGVAYPVTIIEAGPCYVTQVRLPERDGYSAIQLGFGEIHPKKLAGGELGHLKANELSPLRFLREFRSKETANVGDKVTVRNVCLSANMWMSWAPAKAKVLLVRVKRHHFQGGKDSCQSDRHRAPGSRGAGTTTGRVSRMHAGLVIWATNVSLSSTKSVLVDTERNLLGVHGAFTVEKVAWSYQRSAKQ